MATQCFPPDPSTTATYIGAIANALAADNRVVVLSASPNSGTTGPCNPEVIAIPSWTPEKGALVKRMISIVLLAGRMLFSVLTRTSARDVVFCVTTPFTLPYFAILGAKLRGAAAVLLIYDLYPEALIAAGMARPSSLTTRLIRFANGLIFRASDAIITIGRDVGPLLLRYSGVRPDKIHFIPNWTLLPGGYREIDPANPFRRDQQQKLVVGLSGNLGFTHSPRTVFEAAQLLRHDPDIHFLLSGWGLGWKELLELQNSQRLENVTLIEPVPESELVDFLSSADLWIIPYRRNTAGVSVPSRFYNLLAVGRPIMVSAESDSEAALVVKEDNVGWAVPPEDPVRLAEAIRQAAQDRAGTAQKGQRAAKLAVKYGEVDALARYRKVILQSLRTAQA
ncbi:MAG: glycosyltransferase family 4 protein [Bradyrhizobium sp.]|nr:glycosyltransferase family 4 protein [Bradyrhizobium sp.]